MTGISSLSKEPLKAGGAERDAARYVLVRCFDQMLRLLHPFMPFCREELWQAIRPYLERSPAWRPILRSRNSRFRQEQGDSVGGRKPRDAPLYRGDRGDQFAAVATRLPPGDEGADVDQALRSGSVARREFSKWRQYAMLLGKARIRGSPWQSGSAPGMIAAASGGEVR